MDNIKLQQGLAVLQAFSGKAVSDTDFSQIIRQALEDWGVAEQDLRDGFGLSADAISRWRQGHNLPQPTIRPVVLDWLEQNIAERLA